MGSKVEFDFIRASAPAMHVKELSESDHTFPSGATLYVGVGGDLEFIPSKNSESVTMPFATGSFVPIRAKSVSFGSATTASRIFAIW